MQKKKTAEEKIKEDLDDEDLFSRAAKASPAAAAALQAKKRQGIDGLADMDQSISL